MITVVTMMVMMRMRLVETYERQETSGGVLGPADTGYALAVGSWPGCSTPGSPCRDSRLFR